MANAIAEKKETAVAENTSVDLRELIGISREELDDLDYTVLPAIRFDGEVFKVRGADWSIDNKKGFEAVILSVTPIYYYKGSDDHAIQGFYTYDDELTTRGEPVEDIIDMWERDGVKWTKKKYFEVKVLMVSPEDAKGSLAMVSISPTSTARFQHYLKLELGLKHRKHPSKVVTRFAPSKDKVRGSNGRMYAPWHFEYVRDFEGL